MNFNNPEFGFVQHMENSSSARNSVPTHLVILVHGINTRALWMTEIKQTLEEAGFSVAATSYGEFGVSRFLAPLTSLRKKAINRVVANVKLARTAHRLEFGAEPELMSVISHSFGTYVISRILAEYPEFKWHKIIFCGSVLKDDYNFDEVLSRFSIPLINEVGTRDYLPALAESAGWGYGSVGSTGFNAPPVETRWHNGLSHSNFLTQGFCSKFWIPILRGEKFVYGDASSALPLYIRILARLRLRWAPIALIFLFLLYIVNVSYGIWVSWSWQPPSVGSIEERRSQMRSWRRLPDGSQWPAFLRLEGTWLLLENRERVEFSVTPLGNAASFLYFGKVIITPSLRDDGANVQVLGNSLRCFYKVQVVSKTKMRWDLMETKGDFFKDPLPSDGCPPSSTLKRVE